MHPILFEIGPLTIHTYGAVVALAFLTGFLLLSAEARRKNFYPDKILDIELVILVFGMIGARILHVLVNFDFYARNPLDILMIWRGGVAFYGGLIMAIAASWIFILKNRMPFLKTADFIIPYIALGHAIGRIGCFLNGCCFGKPAAAMWPGVVFPNDGVFRHPTQIYASCALLFIFVILKIAGEKPHADGSVFVLYLVLFGVQRFLIDFLRGDNPTYALGFTVSQFISIGLFVTAGVLFCFVRCKKT